MTVGTFLNPCEASQTELCIEEIGKGRVYDGTIYTFKCGDDQSGLKSKLLTKKITRVCIGTVVRASGTSKLVVPQILITI